MVSDSSGDLHKDKQVTIFEDGEQSREFTYVENVVKANLLAVKSNGVSGGVFNIACGDRLSINGLARLLAEVVGADPKLKPRYAAPRPGDVLHPQADILKARKLLGYEAAVGTREGLERTVEWYKLKLG